MKLTKRQKLSAAVVGVAVFSGLAMLGYSWWPGGQRTSSAPDSSLATTPVRDAIELIAMKLQEVNSYARKVVHSGTVQTRSHTMVSFQRDGLVTELLVEEGQRVQAGQQLGVLDSRLLNARRQSLLATIKQANAMLAELHQGPRTETIETARNVVVDLQEQLNAQELRLQRSASLLETKSIARQDYERELYAKRGLEARLAAAQSQLDELLAGTREEKIAAQQALVRSLQADLQSIEYQLADCRLLAPFAGVIVTRFIDTGAVVTAGTPVFELIDDRHLEIHAGIPLALSTQLRPNAEYPVIAGSRRLTGVLRVVMPRIDAATRTVRAIFDVSLAEDATASVVTGQLVKVELFQEVEEPGFWVPRLALTADHSGLWSCLVVQGNERGGQAVKQSVEILHIRDEWAYVRGTLQTGQILIRDGMHRVVPGQNVTVRLSGPDTASSGLSSAVDPPSLLAE
jgi:multidrug efflux pump subunit AcrA (membrane-fusion protein)